MSQEKIKERLVELRIKLKTETNLNERVHIMDQILDWEGRLEV